MNKIPLTCIIDDDPIFIYGTKRLLDEIDFAEEILVFNDGEIGITGLTALIEKGSPLPDVIFLDLNMPIMNGWEFLDAFLEIPLALREHVSIYILSSSVDPRDLEKVKEYSVINNYILKPLSRKILRNIKEAVIQE